VTHPNGYFETSQIVMGNRQAKEKSKPLTQINSQQIRKQQAMNKQQEFKRKMDARVKEEQDFEEELWKLSQREEEILEQWKVREEETANEISQIASMQWEDDDNPEEIKNYL
jgi:hypothetical protein